MRGSVQKVIHWVYSKQGELIIDKNRGMDVGQERRMVHNRNEWWEMFKERIWVEEIKYVKRIFIEVILEITWEVCGTKRINNKERRKGRRGWNQQIKRIIFKYKKAREVSKLGQGRKKRNDKRKLREKIEQLKVGEKRLQKITRKTRKPSGKI